MKAESHSFQCLPLKNRYPGSQQPELCVQWLYFNDCKCASFLSPRPQNTQRWGLAWISWLSIRMEGPMEFTPPGGWCAPLRSPPWQRRVHFTTRIRQVEPQWDNQDGGWGVRPEAVYCMYSLGLYGLHLKPGSAQALILENRTNSLITPQNATDLFGGKFQIWLFS